MIQSPSHSSASPTATDLRSKRQQKRTQGRLVLWMISSVLLLGALLLIQESRHNAATLGVLIGASWLATILVNAMVLDYLLRWQRGTPHKIPRLGEVDTRATPAR